MLKSEAGHRTVGSTDRRYIAAGRLAVAALLAGQVLTYRILEHHRFPAAARPWAFGLAACLAIVALVQLAPAPRISESFARTALALDACVAVAALWVFSFDPSRSLVPLLLLVVLEATLVTGLVTGVLIWAALTAGYIVAELWGTFVDRTPVSPLALALQPAVGLLVALILGGLSRDLAVERGARLSEREGQRRRFHDIVSDIDAIVWEADAATRQFFFVSKQAERILGHPLRRWLAEPSFRTRLIHPDDRDRVVEKYRDAARSGRHDQFEYRLRTAEDRVLWMTDRVSPVREPGGAIRQLRGVMIDITERRRAEDSLRNSFGMLFANNPQPMWAYDRETLKFLAVNDASVELYRYSRDEFLTMRITDLCSPEEVDRLLLDMLRNRGAFERSGEWQHRLRDGSIIDVELTSHTLEFDRRRASLVMVENITERKRAERQLREAQVRYQTLVEQMPAVTYVSALDDRRSTVYMSPQVHDLLGHTQQEWRADPDLWQRLLHPDDRAGVMEEIKRSNAALEPFVCEYRMNTRDGRIVWVRDEAIVMRDDSGEPQFWQGVMLDLTDRKQAEKQIAFLAYHDELTGLPNRAMFQEVLEVALARARRGNLSVAVLYLDLDDFKLVNDSLGHSAGDDLLRQLAGRVRAAIRDADVVSRVGGDEFLVLAADLERVPEDERGTTANSALLVAESLARRIQDSLRVPFVLEGTEVYVSGSIGISVFPVDAEDSSTLMKNADLAMYRSKKERPGGCMIFAEEARSSLPDLSFATRLRKAVDGRQWVLHYQPILDLVKGSTVGVEALLRWQDPDVGIIAPGEFIPLAEEMGLIGAIGDWVMEEVARQQHVWQEQRLKHDVTFNLSPRQLWEPNLVGSLLNRLDAQGIEPARVVVEITESAAMTDLGRTQPILWEMHRQGLRLAIDDFGMGYSSLSRLKQLPVDILKIDRFFIRDLPDDRDARSMVEAIIRLAKSLDMEPLAEGIETEEQWRFLTEAGCTLGQGFHFAKPMPAEAITPLLARDRAFVTGR